MKYVVGNKWSARTLWAFEGWTGSATIWWTRRRPIGALRPLPWGGWHPLPMMMDTTLQERCSCGFYYRGHFFVTGQHHSKERVRRNAQDDGWKAKTEQANIEFTKKQNIIRMLKERVHPHDDAVWTIPGPRHLSHSRGRWEFPTYSQITIWYSELQCCHKKFKDLDAREGSRPTRRCFNIHVDPHDEDFKIQDGCYPFTRCLK